MENTFENLRHRSNFLLTTLKPKPKADDVFLVEVAFSGYSSLICTVSDLMKLCALAMQSEEPYLSPLISNTQIDLAGIMELALQLMPIQEAEFLDVARELFHQK